MRVLLVQPDQNHSLGFQHWARVEPLGLEMIAGALWGQHEVALLDLRLDPDGLADTLAGFRPHLVGICATFTIDIYRALGIASAVKAANPRSFVFVGGHHPSLRPEDFCHPAVDALVVGEGELTATELVDTVAAGGDLAHVPGLVLNRAQGQQFTGQRPLLKDLDALPYPTRTLNRARRPEYYMVLIQPVAMVETTRGCPYRCRFCSVWPFYRGLVRAKSPQRVVRELEAIEEPNVVFTDDSFLTKADRAGQIARLIGERGIQKRYGFQARSDDIIRHPEVIGLWREVGLAYVFVGFERPDQRGLETVNKHSSVEDNEEALEILRSFGIEPIASFISDPSDGHEDFAALRAYMRRLKLTAPFFSILTPLPGTALFAAMEDRLTTANYELFDLAHAVTPTRLPLAEFYGEFARLWRQAYPYRRLQFVRLTLTLRDLLSRRAGTAGLYEVLKQAQQHGDVEVYLRNWAQAAGSVPTHVPDLGHNLS
jgi:radical SAM superfamily enzyme YgiQ (UPF0313 family)